MKARLGILAIAATLSIASAQAGTVIYDSINVDPSLRDTGNRNYVGTPNLVPVDGGDPVTGPWQIDPFNLGPLNLGGSGGIANSFNVSATAQITRVQLLMAADATDTPRDSFMVYLMQDVGGTPTTPNSPIPHPIPYPMAVSSILAPPRSWARSPRLICPRILIILAF